MSQWDYDKDPTDDEIEGWLNKGLNRIKGTKPPGYRRNKPSTQLRVTGGHDINRPMPCAWWTTMNIHMAAGARTYCGQNIDNRELRKERPGKKWARGVKRYKDVTCPECIRKLQITSG